MSAKSEGSPGFITLKGANRATEIFLIDSTFKRVRKALGRLRGSFPAGVYKARYQMGSAIRDEYFEIRAGQRPEVHQGKPVIARSPSPLPFTGVRTGRGAIREMDPALRKEWWSSAGKLSPGPDEGVLHVVLREQRPDQAYEIQFQPLGSQGATTARWIDRDRAPKAFPLCPGTYVLSVADGGGRLCRAVPVVKGHQTVVSMQAPDAGGALAAALADSSLLFLPHPISGVEDDLLLQEAAQQALRRSRALLEPRALTGGRTLSPLLRLMATHGLVEATRTRADRPFDPISLPPPRARAVSASLRHLKGSALGGTTDVAALELFEDQPPSRPVDLDVPPLLATTWRTLVASSLDRPESVRGTDKALRMAEHLRTGSLWFLWWERGDGAKEAPPALTSTARSLLDPQLRANTGRIPSWVSRTARLADLAAANARALASSLQLPIPLVLSLGRQMDEQRLREGEERVDRRVEALASRAPVGLVALPDGVRVDPRHGQPLDFEAVWDLVDGALTAHGLVAVRAPPVSAGSREMKEALANADVLIADLTYGDREVRRVAEAWLALHPRRRARRDRGLIAIHAEGHPSAARPPGASGPVAYQSSFGTGMAFANPAQLGGALERLKGERRGGRRPRGRTSWVKRLEFTERRRLELRRLRAELGQRGAQISRLVSGRNLHAALKDEPPAVQLDTFLLLRACEDWSGMERAEQAMAPSLRKTILVREQLALAIGRQGRPDEAIGQLESVLAEIGANGETCGLLGRVYKDKWERAVKAASPRQARDALDQAIRWYQKGWEISEDPYPGVNALTLLAAKGTREAWATHRRLLPLVERVALQRLHGRPSYWDLASMVEIAAHRPDSTPCEAYHRLALAAPHEPWQRRTTAANLRVLREAIAAGSRGETGWLDDIIGAFH